MSNATVVRPLPADLKVQAANARPFPHVVIDNFLDEQFARQVVAAWPSYDEAAKVGTTFRSINERNKVQVTDSEVFPEPVRLLHEALAAPEFIEQISEVFGIADLLPDPELVGGGLHQTGPRGRLDVHVDFNYLEERRLHRRLNILVYFNEGWKPEWGGNLELWNADVSECVHTVEPLFNRCVIFATSEISFHGVTQVTCPENVARRSFAGYYYTTAAPVHWDGTSHSTIFRARPEEAVKGRMMAVAGVRTAARTKAKQLLRSTPLVRDLPGVRKRG